MENTRERNETFLFADMDFRTPLSSVPKPPKADFSKALNPLKWFVIIALSGIFTGGISTLIWYAYMQGYDEANAEHAPEIKPDDSPLKVKPDEAGGLVVPHQNRHVYEVMKGGKVNDQVEHLLPMPEAPLTREPQEEEMIGGEAEALVAQEPLVNVPVTEEEVADVKMAPPQVEEKKIELVKVEEAKPEVKQEVKKVVAEKPAPAVANIKVRLQFATLRTPTAAEREVTRIKSQFRSVLGSVVVSAQRMEKEGETVFRIQSGSMDLKEAEKLQKQLAEKKLTAVILR